MQLFTQLQQSFLSLYQERKKTVIVVCILGGLAIIGLLAGILLPTNSSSNANRSDKSTVNTTLVDVPPTDTVPIYTPVPPTPYPTKVLTKEEKVELFGTPTPTPLPGTFYTPNGKQNDLEIRYYHDKAGDSFDEVRIVNKKTTEERIIGYMSHYTPGDNATFSKDFSQVIYVGGQSKDDVNKISFYSIPQKRTIKEISLTDIKRNLPSLQIDPLSSLSVMAFSPDKSKLAVSYGTTFSYDRIDPNGVIIVVNIYTNNMTILPVNGLVKSWKNDTVLEYQLNTTDPNVNNTQEVQVPSL